MRRMMVEILIPEKWKQLWNICDLRAFIILSLSLQTFLILIAPLRKRTKNNWIVIPLWSAYLLVDWATNVAVGLISSSQGNLPNDTQGKKGARVVMENEDLLAFWAPFLLVHLGGPDTITAFSLEDNELWLRHLLGLVFQCIAAVYVFVQSLPENRLWIPTMLMLVTGIIKYAERTRSLYLASTDRFKNMMLTDPDPGLNYAKVMDEYFSKKAAKLPTRIQMVPKPDKAAKSERKAKKGILTELEVVQYAYQFFETFKGLVVYMNFSRTERNRSRDFFMNRTAKDAFKVVEIELNFLYDVLFTKYPVVFCWTGAVSRAFSFTTVCSAIVLFVFEDKTNFKLVDVTITYGLLFGALALDLVAIFMVVFSDWTIIKLRKSPNVKLDNKSSSLKTNIVSAFLRLRTEGTLRDTKDFQSNTTGFKRRWSKWDINVFKRRWSESIYTYNLIYFCLHPRPKWRQFICDYLGLSALCDGIKYVESETITPELKEFIFEELKEKSELADDLETTKEIISARGDWVIRVEEGWGTLLKYVLDVDYDRSLILWHIATELCYNKEFQKETTGAKEYHRIIAKLLSDYMMYILIMQPSMMSAVELIGQIRFRDTCAEAKRLFESGKSGEVIFMKHVHQPQGSTNDKKVDWEQIIACQEILDVSTEVPPITVKGERSKSLLFDSCILAKELMEIEEKDASKNKWLIISKVWVELLCYGASHSRAITQAAQVSKGGELITIVWLLMAHFGLSDQFEISDDDHARAKLIVGK